MLKAIVDKARKQNKKVYVYSHKFPDGDAIASSFAVVEYFKNQGIESEYIVTTLIREFKPIIEAIPIKEYVDKNQISIILDTSTTNYLENKFYEKSESKDVYVIDHHEKDEDSICIEEELSLDNNNVIRDPNASSVCEILANELPKGKITPKIADLLILGLLTDTGKLNYLKENTLCNLSKLLELGADYEKILESCTVKSELRQEVGLAKTFLNVEQFHIGDIFGLILPIDNEKVHELNLLYRIRNPQKKIFKMLDIENCGFVCIFAENFWGNYDAEFRSTAIYGNLNVLKMATGYNGGGHYNAAGCFIRGGETDSKIRILSGLKQRALELYSKQATNLDPINLGKQDLELEKILSETDKLKKGVTPEILAKVDRLIKNGANYQYLFKDNRSFEKFMLQNRILSAIQPNVYYQEEPVVNINLSQEDVDTLCSEYNVTETDILQTINIFKGIKVAYATIVLPNGVYVSINSNGDITKKTSTIEKTDGLEI